MPPMPPVQFIHQDLRRQTFRGQPLSGAYFEGCDLRGCDFSRADLQAARFVNCRVGVSPRWAIALVPILILAGLMIHAVSTLVFGALGILPGAPAWPYVKTLYIVLAIAMLSAGWQTLPWPLVRGTRVALSTAVAALMGFFYAGRVANNDPMVAIAGAIALGLLGLGLGWRIRALWLDASLGALGAIAAYGCTVSAWTHGSSVFTSSLWAPGVGWGAIALLGIGVTLRSLGHGGRSLWQFATTSFRHATLTDCRFIGTDMTHCDLTHTIRSL